MNSLILKLRRSWTTPNQMKFMYAPLATTVRPRRPRGQFATISKYLGPPYQVLSAKM